MKVTSRSEHSELGVVVCTFNPSTWETEAGGSEFEASLVYIESPGQAGHTEKSFLEKTKKQRNKKTKPKQTKMLNRLVILAIKAI